MIVIMRDDCISAGMVRSFLHGDVSMMNVLGMLILHTVKHLCMTRVLKCFYVYHNMHGSIIDKTASHRKK